MKLLVETKQIIPVAPIQGKNFLIVELDFVLAFNLPGGWLGARRFIRAFDKLFFIAISMSPHTFHAAFVSLMDQKKTGTEFSVAGFTIRSLMPVVTTLGYQFIASTIEGHSSSLLLGISPATMLLGSRGQFVLTLVLSAVISTISACHGLARFTLWAH